VVFARTFEECAELLAPDRVVVVRGRVQAGRNGRAGAAAPAPGSAAVEEEEHPDQEPVSVIAESVYELDDVRLVGWNRHSQLHLRLRHGQEGLLPALRSLLERHRGEVPVVLHIHGGRAVDEISLGADWSVQLGPPLERAVESLLGEGCYRVEVARQRAPEREGPRRR